jgi:hypothetical protein
MKYELVKTDTAKSWDGQTLYRIRALINVIGVCAAGDLGGYVENERNLSQVSDNAWVSGNAKVSGNAWVFGNAWVSGNARVSGNAQVFGNARVSDNAWVSGNAQVSGNAKVSDNAWVSPTLISGWRWTVTIADNTMAIGCETHTIQEWSAFTDEEINEMHDDATAFWTKYKTVIFAIIDARKNAV